MARLKLTKTANRERAVQVYDRLREAYPDVRCTLDFRNPLELLVATILAAQCTDKRVNQVTPSLFKKYPSARKFAEASRDELEDAIRTCGFYRNKAKSIQGACQALVEHFDGQVPGTMEELLELDGVGRKTANVVLGEFFEAAGVVVDTHCGRLARRLGFTKHDDPVKVEKDLTDTWRKEHWSLFSHCLVFHGRAVCHSRSPVCSACVLSDLCSFPTTAQGRKIAK